jgi:hypothetical protein
MAVKAKRKRRPRRKRIGRVSYYFHHGAWWVYYTDGDRPIRHRTGPDEETAQAIAADTWIDREAIQARLGGKRGTEEVVGKTPSTSMASARQPPPSPSGASPPREERPWWLPGFCDEIPRWLDHMQQAAGPISSERLRDDSFRYAMLMRKFQIETFRREVPYGGYNVSVIRDFSTASMGLLDYLGRPKWSAADWAWQGDTMCLLKTDADHRSFPAGGRLRGEILLSHFGREPIANGQLQVVLQEIANRGEILQRCNRSGIEQNVGTLSRLAKFDWVLPPPKESRQNKLTNFPVGNALRGVPGAAKNGVFLAGTERRGVTM